MKTKLLLAILIAFLMVEELNSQVTLEWAARYNTPGGGGDDAKAIALDSMVNVYVTGNDAGTPCGFITIKYNAAGVQQWATRFSGINCGAPRAIATDRQMNVYVAAMDFEYIVIKYDSNGLEQWVRRFRGSGGDAGISGMVIDKGDNIIVTGTVNNIGTRTDYGTIKYRPNGDTAWVQFYNTPNNGYEHASAITLDKDDGVAIAGQTMSKDLSDRDMLTVKYDSNGVQQWARGYNHMTNGSDAANYVDIDLNGNVYITGSIDASILWQKIATLKYNNTGILQWVSVYQDTAEHCTVKKLKVDNLNHIIVIGTNGYQPNRDWTIIKYDSLGNQQWVNYYYGEAWGRDDFVEDIDIDEHNDIYVTGTSTKSENPPRWIPEIVTIKYYSNGATAWIQKYSGPDSIDFGKSLVIDKFSNIYVAGYSSSGDPVNSNDMLVLKYSQLTGISPISGEMPGRYEMQQNYPNPFNLSTVIRFALPQQSYVELKVYDILGRELTVLVKEHLNGGVYQVQWNADEYSSGIYLYRLRTKNYMKMMKMLMIK